MQTYCLNGQRPASKSLSRRSYFLQHLMQLYVHLSKALHTTCLKCFVFDQFTNVLIACYVPLRDFIGLFVEGHFKFDQVFLVPMKNSCLYMVAGNFKYYSHMDLILPRCTVIQSRCCRIKRTIRLFIFWQHRYSNKKIFFDNK